MLIFLIFGLVESFYEVTNLNFFFLFGCRLSNLSPSDMLLSNLFIIIGKRRCVIYTSLRVLEPNLITQFQAARLPWFAWYSVEFQANFFFKNIFSWICILFPHFWQRERWQKPILRRLQVSLITWLRAYIVTAYICLQIILFFIMISWFSSTFFVQPPPPVNDTNPYNVFRPREKTHRLHTRRVGDKRVCVFLFPWVKLLVNGFLWTYL